MSPALLTVLQPPCWDCVSVYLGSPTALTLALWYIAELAQMTAHSGKMPAYLEPGQTGLSKLIFVVQNKLLFQLCQKRPLIF